MIKTIVPTLFHDVSPLRERVGYHTGLIFSYQLNRVMRRFVMQGPRPDSNTMWSIVKEEFPEATHVFRGIIYDKTKWILRFPYKPGVTRKMNEFGIAFNRNGRAINGHHKVLGGIRFLWQEGIIWHNAYRKPSGGMIVDGRGEILPFTFPFTAD